MAGIIKNFIKIFCIAAFVPVAVFGDQAPNLRGGNARSKAIISESDSDASIRRAATSVIARTAAKNNRKDRKVVSSRNVTSRSATTVRARSPEKVTINSANASRAAVAKKVNLGRAAASNAVKIAAAAGGKYSRAAKTPNKARATAVFNDVSKIGGGYAACRDSYATCMDQFCAVANDQYRRCFCSDRFTSFRDTSDALDSALQMLADFQDNNLNAVDKTAAEVNAMYSASEGEAAIKRDTSASQKLLDNIADLLSGKKKTSSSKPAMPTTSVGILDLSSFSLGTSDGDDIWGGSSSVFSGIDGGIFNSRGSGNTNLSEKEGADLYNNANRQCIEVTKNECGSDAVFNLARSAYSIMITQDCNLYEKSINSKRESVQQTVRTAEKYLRDARLEEYRAHNSQDVNDCLNKVETAIRQPTACGPNYEKCLDYTGQYVNMVTGEPIYSKALFGLNDLIVLDGSADVMRANPGFDTFLEERKMFATQALDSCRSIADTVWYEFKRTALIQIAQAQDAKIEEVKDSCVQTMKNCYDKQTGDLNELGGEDTVKLTSAISAIAAHDMCRDQVLACAALYGNPDSCVYDDKTKTIKDKDGGCGLKSLLAYVNTVDSVKVAQGCENSLREYAKELCASGDEAHEYPWGCRLRSKGKIKKLLAERAELFCGQKLIVNEEEEDQQESITPGTGTVAGTAAAGAATASTATTQNDKAAMHKRVYSRAATNQGGGEPQELKDLDSNLITGITDPDTVIEKIVSEIKRDLQMELNKACYSVSGEGQLLWVENTSGAGFTTDDTLKISSSWMKTVFGTDSDLRFLKDNYGVHGFNVTVPGTGNTFSTGSTSWLSFGWGLCVQPSVKLMCGLQSMGTYNKSKDSCEFNDDKWHKQQCAKLGGYMAGGKCYLK